MYTYLVDTAHKRETKRHVLSQLDTNIHLGPPSRRPPSLAQAHPSSEVWTGLGAVHY